MDNKFNFSSKFRIANIFSLILFLTSILFILFKGLNYGIDFKGGTLIELRASNTGASEIRTALNKMDLIPEDDRDAFVTKVTAALSNGLAGADKIFPISSVSGLGTKSLIDSAMEYMSRIKQEDKTTNTNSLNKV